MFRTTSTSWQTSSERQQSEAVRDEPREELKEQAVLKEEPKEEPLTPQNDLVAASCPIQFPLCIKDDPDADQPGTCSPPRLAPHQPSSSRSRRKWRPAPCPHCGDSVQTLKHFVYRDLIFCEEEGETLETYLKDRGVSRTTIWRLKKKQEMMLTWGTIGDAVKDEPDSGSDEDQQGEDGETLEDRGAPRPTVWRVQTSSETQDRVLVKEEPRQEPLTPENQLASCLIHVPPRVKDDPDQPELSQPSTWSRPGLEVYQPSTSTETLSSRQEPGTTVWRVQSSSESRQRVLVKEEPRQEPLTPEDELASCLQSAPRVKDESDSDQTLTSEPSTSSSPRQEDYQPSTSGSTGTSSSSCPHCGDSAQTLKHFVYKDLIFCEEAAEEGETLEKWLKDRGVPKTTVWRIKKKQEVLLVGGSLPRRKDRVCHQCGERKTKANGHTILRAVRETFCSKTDPLGRTVEQWLTEKRGGVTTEQLKELDRAVRNARAKEKRARILGRLPPKQPAVTRGAFQKDMTPNGTRRRRRDGGAVQNRLSLRNSKKKREFPDFYVYT